MNVGLLSSWPWLDAAPTSQCDDGRHKLENYFLRGPVGAREYPVAAYIVVEHVPRTISTELAVDIDRRSIRQVLDNDVELSAPGRTTVAGEPALTYDQALTLGDISGRQRLVTFKRGPYAAYTITLTAPTRRTLEEAVPGLEDIVRSWHWTG